MKLGIYVLYDSTAKVYGRPLVFNNDDEAGRWFMQAVMNQETKVAQNVEDYSIHNIGSYIDVSAIIKPTPAPRKVMTGVEAVRAINAREARMKALQAEITTLREQQVDVEDIAGPGGTA